MKETSRKTLILSREEIQSIVSKVGLDYIMDSLIERFNNELIHFDAERTDIPIRSGFNYKKPEVGLIEWMPIYSNEEKVTIKVVGYHPNNPTNFKLPTILSTVSSYDTSTGHLLSLMDGVLLTALRTGAASAVASRYLANPQSKVLGLIGCGAQSVTQLHAISRIFDLERILIYDVDIDSMLTFSERISSHSKSFNIEHSTIEEIIINADIVCTATSIEPGEGPLFKQIASKSGQHINAIGSDFPGKIELPLDLLKRSFVCPDFLNQALIEGECQNLTPDLIGSELVDVVKNSDRYLDVKTQQTVFDSTGWALEDKVAMELFADLAIENGIGQRVEVEIFSEDAKNPYGFLKEALISNNS